MVFVGCFFTAKLEKRKRCFEILTFAANSNQ